MSTASLVLLLLSSLLLTSATANLLAAARQTRLGRTVFSFSDVTTDIGLRPRQESEKWGGPCVADLNSDGIYDLILSYHGQYPMQIYFGNGDGTFTQDPFSEKTDIHGINVGPRSTFSRDRIMAVNVGGGRGNNLRPPQNYVINPEGKITNITTRFGLGRGIGRGRISLFMDLSLGTNIRRGSGPDIAVVSFLGAKSDGLKQYAYRNNGGFYRRREVPGFADERHGRAAPIDFNGDGVMEIFVAPRVRIYQLVAPFKFVDATDKFIDPSVFGNDETVSSVAEIDVDNDGIFEIYVARTRTRDLVPFGEGTKTSDVLLKREKGRLVDISDSAGIPNNTRSVGVTVADFDNDGYVDVYVSLLVGRDIILKNNGDGTFRRINGLVPKDRGVKSEKAVAVDYDEDGLVDVIVSQGGAKDEFGPYRVMRNLIPKTENRHHLFVRVGHHPDRVATALHAVVIVRVGGMRMIRRVGSPGSQTGGPSFLDTVHFGLGSFEEVETVRVKWTGGAPKVLRRVAADQKVTFGIV